MEEKKERRPRRKKLEVRMDILDAVGRVLREHGYAKLGINLVAEYAHVDKNVIYRNFGSFEGLLDQYVQNQDYWIKTIKEYEYSESMDYRSLLKRLLIDQLNYVNQHREIQQLLVWELGENNIYTRSIANRREDMIKGILQMYSDYFKETRIDFNALSALLLSGIYYLVLHKDVSGFCHLDINRKDEAARLERAIETFIDLMFESMDGLDKPA